jgi:hypothetical protein
MDHGSYDAARRQAAVELPFNALLLLSDQWTNGVGVHRQQTAVFGPSDEVLSKATMSSSLWVARSPPRRQRSHSSYRAVR